MGKKFCFIAIVMILFLFFADHLYADKAYKSKRWRLKFEGDAPTPITITHPDGKKETYWYVRYKVINETERDIPWMINVKLVIDKPAEAVTETKVPELFYNGEIPSGQDKEEYLKNLKSYYDTNFSVVKKAICDHLRLHPQLSKQENAVLSALHENTPKTVFQIMGEVGLSYEETESCLTNLVVNNLSISQEIKENPIFARATIQKAIFLVNDEKTPNKTVELSLSPGDKIADWEVVSFTRNRVVMKKKDVITTFAKGATIEYLYSKVGKIFIQRDFPHVTGMGAKGTYKGRVSVEESPGSKQHIFEKTVIPQKSIRYGLAIFSDVSAEMDYMGVVVTGLVDPIFRRKDKIYVENEAFICAYKRPGDEFGNDREPIARLYEKWMVLSLKEVKWDKGGKRVLVPVEEKPAEAKDKAVEEEPEKTPPAKEEKKAEETEEEDEKSFVKEESETTKEEEKTKPEQKPYVAIAEKFIKAKTKDQMIPHCSKDFGALLGEKTSKLDASKIPTDIKIVDSSQTGNKAKVVFESKQKADQKVTVYMVKEGDDWKADDVGIVGPKGEMKVKLMFKMLRGALDKMGDQMKGLLDKKEKEKEKEEEKEKKEEE
jgi:hypothetical protein